MRNALALSYYTFIYSYNLTYVDIFAPDYLLWNPIQTIRSSVPENIVQKIWWNIHNSTQSCFKIHCTYNTLLHTSTIEHMKKFLRQSDSYSKRIVWNKTATYYTRKSFTSHCTLLNMTTFLHQSELIQKNITLSWITSPLGQIIIKSIQKLIPIIIVAYMLDVIYFHQRNIIFLLFAHVIKYYIENFMLGSKITTLALNCYISPHATARFAYFLFQYYLQVLPT